MYANQLVPFSQFHKTAREFVGTTLDGNLTVTDDEAMVIQAAHYGTPEHFQGDPSGIMFGQRTDDQGYVEPVIIRADDLLEVYVSLPGGAEEQVSYDELKKRYSVLVQTGHTELEQKLSRAVNILITAVEELEQFAGNVAPYSSFWVEVWPNKQKEFTEALDQCRM